VQYVYDDASGALSKVANADTGFIYWQADTDDGVAPVDAFGHLLAFTDGNGVSTVSTYDAATGAATGIGTGNDQDPGNSFNVQQLTYSWDGYGNLLDRIDHNQNLTETLQYDALNRLTDSAVTNPAGTNPNLSLSYDALGNITCKSDVVGHACAPGSTDYTYGGTAGPHAVTSITGSVNGTPFTHSYGYNPNGDMNDSNGTNIQWNIDNLPVCIDPSGGNCSGGSDYSTFSYGPDHQRYQQAQANGTVTTYIGGLYEVVSTSGGTSVQYRHNIVAGGQVIAVHTLDQSGNAKTDYLHYDQLGSVDAITDDTGAVLQRMSYDAFGKRRNPTTWVDDLSSTDIASLKDYTDRGFTDQEQLDNVGLVHMNGRVYDPQIGRFISADPTVPDPMYSQAFNRYSYVYNSPLAYTDPSGFFPDSPAPPGSPLYNYLQWGAKNHDDAVLGTLQSFVAASTIAESGLSFAAGGEAMFVPAADATEFANLTGLQAFMIGPQRALVISTSIANGLLALSGSASVLEQILNEQIADSVDAYKLVTILLFDLKEHNMEAAKIVLAQLKKLALKNIQTPPASPNVSSSSSQGGNPQSGHNGQNNPQPSVGPSPLAGIPVYNLQLPSIINPKGIVTVKKLKRIVCDDTGCHVVGT
jgi:RHS repeat-associated protein